MAGPLAWYRAGEPAGIGPAPLGAMMLAGMVSRTPASCGPEPVH